MNIRVQHLAFSRNHVYPLTHLKEHIKYLGKESFNSFYNKNCDNVNRTVFFRSLNNQLTKGNDCGYKLIITYCTETSFLSERDIKRVIRLSIEDFENKLETEIDWLAINHLRSKNNNSHTHIIIRGYYSDQKVNLKPNNWKLLEKLLRLHAEEVISSSLIYSH